MIKLENTEVFGWEAAIRGMRNPMNSHAKTDTDFRKKIICGDSEEFCDIELGENDLSLMKRLRNSGHDHRKYLRMINVTVDITAPLYWWKEFDTYKVSTTRNSCSTMHKIHAKEFTLDDFSHEHLIPLTLDTLKDTIDNLNEAREVYLGWDKFISKGMILPELKTKKDIWWQMIQLLPSSYNQKATVQLNYEVLNNMYHSRRNHKLDEWRDGFCDWVKTLPYAKELITGEE